MPVIVEFGKWSVIISCGTFGHASKRFTVISPQPAAHVVVANSGFTQSNYGTGAETIVSYGVSLQNDSLIGDALGVQVTVAFADTLGRSVTSDVTTLTGIPAGKKFYLGGLASSNVSLTIASMKVTISVASTQKHRLVLPPVTGLNVMTDGSGNESVNGTFTNPYQAPIPSDATIFVVYVGPQGNIVGGQSETAGSAVQPKEAVAFGVSTYGEINASFIQPTSVSTVDSSVDPCASFLVGGSISFVGSCPAQLPASK